MNIKEKQYAMGRIDAIAAAKCAAISTKHTVPAIKLSPQERLKAFKAGAYKINADVRKIEKYTDVCDVVSFANEMNESQDWGKIRAESKKVTDRATAIKDQLMLGDSAEALRMIEEFSK